MPRTFLIFSLVTMFAGCATAPPPGIAVTSPASPAAPEGARIARQTSLRPDDATRKTRELLSAAQREQKHWDAYGPVSGTPENAPKNDAKPEHRHEHP
jgi:hypothetical protein